MDQVYGSIVKDTDLPYGLWCSSKCSEGFRHARGWCLWEIVQTWSKQTVEIIGVIVLSKVKIVVGVAWLNESNESDDEETIWTYALIRQ